MKAGFAVAALVGTVATAVTFRTRGYAVPARTLRALSAWQFAVVEHAGRRIAAPDRPEDGSIPSADDADVAGFVDAWVARMDPRLRRDLLRFLAYVEHVAPLGAGFVSRFTRLGPADQDRVLASVASSSNGLLRAGFDGLKSLVFLGYYRDPRAWPIVGYDGPLLGRAPGSLR